MQIIRTLQIDAKPEVVFQAVTDFAQYSQWNPWIIKAVGDCRVGANVVVDAVLRGKVQQYNHKILQLDSPHVFHWCDVGWFTRFVDGERIRTFKAHNEGTEYRVELNITGSLAFFAGWLFASSLEAGMSAETDALKTWAEAQAAI